MDIEDAKELVRERLQEYVDLVQSGNDISLEELSTDVNNLLDELKQNGLDIYDQFGVQVHNVQIVVNEFGVVMVRFNGK